MNIAICFGTRPEYLKLLPLIQCFEKHGIPHKVYYIQQHVSIAEELSSNFIKVPLEVQTENRLNAIGASILANLHQYWEPTHTHCVVQGDTSTALFCAIFAFHSKVKIIHIEAGLRTYDLTQPYPEEANRQLISRLASFHFTPHVECEEILRNEKIYGKIFTTGNTILDLIQSYKIKPFLGNKVLITFHRRENWDKLPIFIGSLKKLMTNYPNLEFIWCMHPNPNLQKQILDAFPNQSNIKLTQPLPHKEITYLIGEARFIITDSGGLQEEASFLGKQCMVLRESTERYHIPYPYIHLIKDISTLAEYIQSQTISLLPPCTVYGDGTTCEQIVSILKDTG